MEYGSRIKEKINCNGNEVSDLYVWLNTYRPSEKLRDGEKNWRFEKVRWSSRAVCVEVA